MNFKTPFLPLVLALCLGWTGAASAQAGPDKETNPNKIHHRPNPGHVSGEALTAGGTTALSAITNHGGPVMGSPDIHLLWYGNWNQTNGSDNAGGKQIVIDFIKTVGGSNWMKINTRGGGYTGQGGTAVTGALGSVFSTDVGYLTVSGKPATRLTDANIATIVTNYVKTQGTASTNAIYFVLTSSDVNETSGFCTKYCGWHTSGTINAVAGVKYSFVGNANRCLSSCAPQTTGPNGNAGVDGMVSVVAHELVETLSDPLLNAWYDASGAENGDKCAWTFGSAQQAAPNGSFYNLTLAAANGSPSRSYMIQRNLAVDNKCYVDGVTGQQ